MNKFLCCILILIISIFKFSECRIKVIADDQMQDECLWAHNKCREKHENTPRLTLNRTVVDFAIRRIKSLAKLEGGHSHHHNKVVYGENFYWYYDTKRYHSCEDAVNLWYKGYHHYDYNRPGFTEKSGGYSQVVWRGSKQMGCACVEDDTRNYLETYYLCSYYPPGNVDGQYPYNVMPKIDRPGGGDRPVDNGYDDGRPGGGRPGDRPGGDRPGGDRPIDNGYDNVRPGGGRPGGNDRPISVSPESSRPTPKPRPGKPPIPPSYPFYYVF